MKKTEELLHNILSARDINAVVKASKEDMLEKSLAVFLGEMLRKYQLEQKEVMERAQIASAYGYQIFDGQKKPRRDKIIRLGFGFPLTVDEMKQALRCGGVNDLYPRVKRDAYILYGLQKQMTVLDLNLLLEENGQIPLA